MFINLCQNLPILVKSNEFQALFMKTCVHVWYLFIAGLYN